MRAHWFGASGSIVALLLTFPGAHAQDAAGGTVGVQGSVGVQPTAPAGSTTASAQGEVGVQTRAALTPAEQAAQGDAISRRAGQLATRMTKMLDEARREKDIMRANCINQKLTEVNANTRNIDQRSKALKDAVTLNDEARRSHEFTVLTVLAQKLDSLDAEATQCLGQSVYEPGASQVVTTIQNTTTSTDPTQVQPGAAPPPTLINPVLGSSGM